MPSMLVTAILLLIHCKVSVALQNTKQQQIHKQDVQEFLPALGNISMVPKTQSPSRISAEEDKPLRKDDEISLLRPETQNLILISSSNNQEAAARFMSIRILKMKGNYLVAICASLVVILLGGLYFGAMFCRQGATDSGRPQFESSFPPNDATTHPLVGGKGGFKRNLKMTNIMGMHVLLFRRHTSPLVMSHGNLFLNEMNTKGQTAKISNNLRMNTDFLT